PEHVLAYLGRYTHRVALSNDRLVAVADGRVRFRWRDYADGDRVKLMELDIDEFLRRFLLHIVPDGFVRIRHFGLLANRRRAAAPGAGLLGHLMSPGSPRFGTRRKRPACGGYASPLRPHPYRPRGRVAHAVGNLIPGRARASERRSTVPTAACTTYRSRF